MLNLLVTFFSRLYKFDETGTKVELTSDFGCLLEPCEWLTDRNKGLANYLNVPYKKYVSYIRYRYVKGYIKFDVLLKVDPGTKVKGDVTIVEYIKKFISVQLSDGWGENGIYVIESGRYGDKATVCMADFDDILSYKEYREKDSIFQVGDSLAYRENSGRENLLGKIVNIKYDNNLDDLLYTFENSEEEEENILIFIEAYKL